MKTWNLGLVGTGYYAQNHLRAWQKTPGVQIAALCDRDPDRLREAAEEFHVPKSQCYPDLTAMLEEAELDFVDVVTRPDTHLPLVREIARYGKHILCQKPFAPTLQESAEMVRVAREAGVRLMATENWRWLKPYQKIQEVLTAGTIGKIQVVRFRHKGYSTPCMGPDAKLNQPYFRTMPRLLFYEMGPHWFDVIRGLFGDPERIYAEMGRSSTHVVGDDHGLVVLGYTNFYVQLDMSWASLELYQQKESHLIARNFAEEMVIDGERGTLQLIPCGKTRSGKLILIDPEHGISTIAGDMKFDTLESHCRICEHFLTCLQENTPFATEGSFCHRTLQWIFAAYESADSSSVIKASELPYTLENHE